MLGRTDLPLDELGLTQAETVGPVLGHIDAIWSSPLQRARQTAAAILVNRPHLSLQIDPDLTEMDQGELDGLDEGGLRERFGTLLVDWAREPGGVRLPGGETLDEVQHRARGALERIAAASEPGARVVVVTHQLVMSSTLCGLRGEPLSAWRTHNHRNTAWSEIAWGPVPAVLAARQGPHLI